MVKKERLRNIFVKFLKLQSSLTLILHNTLLHQINVTPKSRLTATTTRYLTSLSNLRSKRSTYSKNVNQTSFIKDTVNNMSSHTLAEHAYNALAFGLDIHIPTRTNKNIIDIEFYFP